MNKPPHSMTGRPLVSGLGSNLSSEAQRSIGTIKRAESKYPSGFVSGFASDVYLLSELKVDSLLYGGTSDFSSRALYVVSVPSGSPWSDDGATTERSFHYELASLIFLSHPRDFPWTSWHDTVGSSFHYGEGGREFIRRGDQTTTVPSREYLEIGFIERYSESGEREDFCTMMSAMMTADEPLWNLILSQPILRRKARLCVEFYHTLDSRITWDWLAGLHESADARETMRTHIAP
jgi:hypothetical protein